MRERRFNSFERSIRVPDGADTEKIEASFKNGVLKVMMPKTAEALKSIKKVEVKGGSDVSPRSPLVARVVESVAVF